MTTTNSLFPDDAHNHSEDDGATAATHAARPFRVKTRTGDTYEFKRFKSSRQGSDVFFNSEGSLEDRLQFYDEIVRRLRLQNSEIDNLRAEEIYAHGGNGVMAYVPIDYLEVDEEWCRGRLIDYRHVAEIVTNFNPASMRPPTVTIRKVYDETTNELINVRVSLPDGVHRTSAAYEMGATHIRAIVIVVASVEEEAKIYSDTNYKTRPHAKLDVLRGRRAAGDAELAKISAIMSDYGFLFPEKTTDKDPPYIKAIQTAQNCYRHYGEAVFRRFLSLVSNPAFPFWQANKRALSGDMMGGLCRFIADFERTGIVHSDLTHNILERLTPDIIEDTGKRFTAPQQVNDLLQKTVIKSKTKVSGESGRAAQVAAALVNTAVEFCRLRKLRPENYHPKIRTALDAYFDKRLSPQETADAIYNARRAMARIKRPDFWYAESELVR